MSKEQPEEFKGFFIERNADDNWFLAVPDGELIGFWLRVTRMDLLNMGIAGDVLDAVIPGVCHRIQINVTACLPLPLAEPVVVSDKPSARSCRGFYFFKCESGQLYLGWPREGALCWKEAELEDLLYLGVNASDIERVTSAGKYFCGLPSVRLEALD